MKSTAAEVARMIDHTLLKPEATPEQVDKLCDEALEYGFCAICVNPIYVARVAERLDRARAYTPPGVKPVVASVVGFPLGATVTTVKVAEARRAMDDGAVEIDLVIHFGALIAGDVKSVRADIEAVAHVVHQHAARGAGHGLLKVILETAALTEEQIVRGCRCCAEGEADFVKTSTGFHSTGGATIDHVRLIHRHASPLKVKASGGIRDAAAALAMIEAGAARIGTSAGVAIVKVLRESA